MKKKNKCVICKRTISPDCKYGPCKLANQQAEANETEQR